VQPRSPLELTRIAAEYGIELQGTEFEQVTQFAATTVVSYERLDELDAPPRPITYPRADLVHRPVGNENPGTAGCGPSSPCHPAS
jgi:hypothetical protein